MRCHYTQNLAPAFSNEVGSFSLSVIGWALGEYKRFLICDGAVSQTEDVATVILLIFLPE